MSAKENAPAKVVSLAVVQGGRNREPQLSDAELKSIRKMLAEWKIVRERDPMISRILHWE